MNSCTVSLKDIALGLDPMQIDTPCVHVFKFKALSINKVQEQSSTVKVHNVEKFLYCKPKELFPRHIALGLDPLQIDAPCVHVFKSKARCMNKVQEKSSKVKVLNVDKFLYCKPKGLSEKYCAWT